MGVVVHSPRYHIELKMTRPAAGRPAALFQSVGKSSLIEERNIWLFASLRFALPCYPGASDWQYRAPIAQCSCKCDYLMA